MGRLVDALQFVLELISDPDLVSFREIFTAPANVVSFLGRRTPLNSALAASAGLLLDWPFLRDLALRHRRVNLEVLRASRSAREHFVRENATVEYHVCGTCRMGRSEDPNAVVSPDGKVIGLEGLRIADASIFPTIPRAHTQMTVVMAAERMAHLFLRTTCRTPSATDRQSR